MTGKAGTKGGQRRRQVISLRMQVALALGVIVFAVAGVLGGIIAQSSALELQGRIGQNMLSDAARIADQVNTEMATRARELFLLGALDPLSSLGDAQQVTSLLAGLRQSVPAYHWLALTDTSGQVVAATNPSLLGRDLGGRSAVQAALRGNISNAVEHGDASGAPQPMILSHPVRRGGGAVVGVIVGEIGWDWIRTIARNVIAEQDTTADAPQFFLLSNDQRVLVGPQDLLGKKLLVPAAERARAGFPGWSVDYWPDGDSYLTGAAFIAGQGPNPGPGSQAMQWTAVVREPVDRAFAPAAELRNDILLGGLALAALASVAGWLIAGWITAPLRRIAHGADRLARGEELELPRVNRPAEIRVLSESLRRMVSVLTQKQVALDEMQEVAQRDALTGLYNRNGLKAWVRTRLRTQDAEAGNSLMVFLTDLDGFKQVNDRFGHPAGDIVLQDVARRMLAHVRPVDTVARLGGDEFVLVLDAPAGPRDPEAEAVAVAVFRAVSGMYDVGAGHSAPVGISLGGAVWPEDDVQFERVMQKADAALYAAKEAGKNRIMLYAEPAAS